MGVRDTNQSDAERSAAGIVVDVREDLRNGREPFQKIMSAAGMVPEGGTMTLFATFKPTPLLAVLRSQGFESEATPIEGGDWKVVFRRVKAAAAGGGPDHAAAGEATAPDRAAAPGESVAGADEIRLDNRGLEPPEPMVRTLEAIHGMRPGQRIVGRYDRRPMFLLPKLEQMGFTYEVNEHDDGSVTVVIARP